MLLESHPRLLSGSALEAAGTESQGNNKGALPERIQALVEETVKRPACVVLGGMENPAENLVRLFESYLAEVRKPEPLETHSRIGHLPAQVQCASPRGSNGYHAEV